MNVNYWQNLIACPHCGNENVEIEEPTADHGQCHACDCRWNQSANHFSWDDTKKISINKFHVLLKKIKNQFNLTSSWLLPFRHLSHVREKKYYQRTIDDKNLAVKWAKQYLKNIYLKPDELVLDHGCGRGRISALCAQLNLQVLGQDIQKNAWWEKIQRVNFQVVPARFTKFPWKNELFSLVLSFEMIHYVDETFLTSLIQEYFRVLKPGGFCIILAANHQSYSSDMFIKQMNHLHPLDKVQTLVRNAGFQTMSLTYEGFYAPFCPLFINFLRKQFSPNFDISDFGSYLETCITPTRRARWLMTLQKPI